MWGTIIICASIVFVYSKIILPFVETRDCERVRIHDPILPLLPIYDCSTPITLINNTSLVLIVSEMCMYEGMLLMFMKINCFSFIIRSVCLVLCPFEPPLAVIPLRDSFIEFFIGGDNKVMVRDEFVSGHTCFMVLNTLLAINPYTKLFHFTGLLCYLPMLLIMRAHWTIDLIIGAMVAFTSHTLFHVYDIL
jgi:hypothetical protein